MSFLKEVGESMSYPLEVRENTRQVKRGESRIRRSALSTADKRDKIATKRGLLGPNFSRRQHKIPVDFQEFQEGFQFTVDFQEFQEGFQFPVDFQEFQEL